MKVEKVKKAEGKRVRKGPNASAFQPNPFYERLLELKDRNPNVFKTMSAATKAALEAYLTNRRKAVSTN